MDPGPGGVGRLPAPTVVYAGPAPAPMGEGEFEYEDEEEDDDDDDDFEALQPPAAPAAPAADSRWSRGFGRGGVVGDGFGGRGAAAAVTSPAFSHLTSLHSSRSSCISSLVLPCVLAVLSSALQ